MDGHICGGGALLLHVPDAAQEDEQAGADHDVGGGLARARESVWDDIQSCLHLQNLVHGLPLSKSLKYS